MPATELDSVWFHSNLDRAYRLRQQTLAEVAAWKVIASTHTSDVVFERLKDETCTVYLTVPFDLMKPYGAYSRGRR